MASSAQINAKVEAAIAASEAGDFESAVVRLREALVLMATTPDREFDNQKVSWREGDLQALLQTYGRTIERRLRRERGIWAYPDR